MRDYARISPLFWTGETGRFIRSCGHEAQVIALYLLTSPGSNMIGLYYLPMVVLCHETGSPFEGASKALRRLSEGGFAHYDERSETVWVVEMARFQVGEKLKRDDNRVKGIQKELEQYRKSPFFLGFYGRYEKDFHLAPLPEMEAPSKPLASPFEGPSEPLRSQEQEQEQEQEKDLAPRCPTSPPAAGVAPLPCVGLGDGGREFTPTEAQVAEWREAFPGIDVLTEIRKAGVWLKANPKRRKTAGGMSRFLVSWLGRAQDSAGTRAAQAPQQPSRASFTQEQARAMRAEEDRQAEERARQRMAAAAAGGNHA